MRFLLLTVLIVVMSGCTSDLELAADACKAVPNDQASVCVSNYLERVERQRTTELMMLEAAMSGYNQAHDREQSRMPISTSCTTTSTGMVNCLSY